MKTSKIYSVLLLFALSLFTTVFCGCFDSSTRAPLPDYSNMSDGGSEHSESENSQ